MKTLLRCVVIAATLTGSVAHAQSIAGTWQGTLNVGKELRIVMTIGNATGGGLTAVMYSIDQGGQGISASPVSFQGTALKLAIGPIGATYEGQLSADGNTIDGTFTQGGKPVALAMRRATADTAWPIPAAPKPMAADAPMVFEVATIKPSNPDAPGKVLTMRGRQFATINTTLSDLISFAYRVHGAQITGAPQWVESARYDITAQPQADGTPNETQLRAMVQKLLEEVPADADSREQGTAGVCAGCCEGRTQAHAQRSESERPPYSFLQGLRHAARAQREHVGPVEHDAGGRAGSAGRQ